MLDHNTIAAAQAQLEEALRVLAQVPGDDIRTFTGKLVCPLALEPDDVCITDVTHALAYQCRFAGHLKFFYSIGEHSVRVSRLVETWGRRDLALWGLLHDASEAYLVDLPAPIKHHPTMLAYRQAEKRAMRAVCEHFALPFDEPPIVKRADRVLLVTEQRDLRMRYAEPNLNSISDCSGIEPLAETITPWTSQMAEREFLARFEALTR